MTEAPHDMTQTPSVAAASLIDDILRRVKLASALYLRGDFAAPWALRSPGREEIASVVAPGAKRLVLLHLAVEGSFHVTLPTGETALVGSGEAVMLPYCDEHCTALKDPLIGPAIAMLHAEPAEAWSVERLAGRLSVSRSVFAERFASAIGQPPMRYLAAWRCKLAADYLRSTTLSLAEIATRIGFDSEAAFGRAFKRRFAASPAAWRNRYDLESAGGEGGRA